MHCSLVGWEACRTWTRRCTLLGLYTRLQHFPDTRPHMCAPLPASAHQVWDDSSRGQVLQVEPFKPWEEQAAQDCGLSGTPTMQVREWVGRGCVRWVGTQAGAVCS